MADPNSTRFPAFASDAWMLEQQMRAQMEAEGWRRLREELSRPALQAPPAQAPQAATAHREPRFSFDIGGAIIKGLVRFGIGASGGYLGYIAAIDSQLGEFEAWLAVIAGFVISLALTAFGPGRRLVHLLADWTRWALVAGAAFGVAWLFGQLSA